MWSIVRPMILPLQPGINECSEAHPGNGAGFAGGDIPVHVGYDALRQIIGLDLSLHGKTSDLWNEPLMATDGALQEPFMAERLQSALFSITLACGEQESKISRLACFDKALF